jgi:hypothetical protein
MTPPSGPRQEPCANPFGDDVLVEYWLGAVDEHASAVDEHLFGCDVCGDRVREMHALIEGIRVLARSGSLKAVVGERFVRRAANDGLKVRQYAPPAGGSVACTVAADDDLLVGRLAADLSSASRIDVSFRDPAGVERQRLADVPFDARAREIVYQESIVFAKGSSDSSMTVQVIAVDSRGGERLLGEFTFNHTRTIPGPASW